MISNFEKLRSYRSFRVPVEDTDKIGFSLELGPNKSELDEFKGIKLINISVTGFGFYSGKEIEEGSIVMAHLDFKSVSLSLEAKVMRTQVVYNDYGEQEKIFYGARFIDEDQKKQKQLLSKLISSFSTKRLKEHITSLLINENEIAEYSIREKVHMLLSLYLDMGRFNEDSNFLELIFLETARLIEAERANLWLLNDERSKISLFDWNSNSPGEKLFSFKDSVVESVLFEGRVINHRIKSIREDDSFFSNLYNEFNIETKSVLLVPIFNGLGHIVGMVEFSNKAGEDFFEVHDELYLTVLTAVVTACFPELEVGPLQEKVSGDFSEVAQKYKIVGSSKSVIKMKEFIDRNKHTHNNILIHGESGAGKLHLAQIIHYYGDSGQMSCGNIKCFDYVNKSNLQHDLRGDEEHVGKLELYSGGSIIVEDVSVLSLDDQRILLDAFKERTDIRIIATAGDDLVDLVEEGEFLSELRDFLAPKVFNVYPLRKRKEDIVALADYYLKDECRKLGFIPKSLSENLKLRFENYEWPGNIEELKTAVKRLVLYYPNSHVIKQCGNDIIPIFNAYHNQYETFEKAIGRDLEEFQNVDIDKFMAFYKGQYIYKALSMYNNDIVVVSQMLQMKREEVDAILEEFDDLLEKYGVKKNEALKEVS